MGWREDLEVKEAAKAAEADRRWQEYLASPVWLQRRWARLNTARFCCEFDDCQTTKGTEVHHRHRNTAGQETDQDLEVLCPKHLLVREVQEFECTYCQSEFVEPEEDAALELVEQAYAAGDTNHEAETLLDHYRFGETYCCTCMNTLDTI